MENLVEFVSYALSSDEPEEMKKVFKLSLDPDSQWKDFQNYNEWPEINADLLKRLHKVIEREREKKKKRKKLNAL